MFSDVTGFQWERPCRGGFAWEPGVGGELVLREKPDTTFVRYSPFREPAALYYELATIELTPEGTVDFANRYGNLGGRTVERRRHQCGPEEWRDEPFELFHAWVDAVAWLREALRIWTLFRNRNIETLAKNFLWENGGVDYVRSRELRADLGADTRTGALKLSTGESRSFDILGTRSRGFGGTELSGDVLRAAITIVTGTINWMLTGHAGPRLGWDTAKNEIIYSDTPFSLFGAVWLQFAQAVHSGKTLKRCRTCGRWFEVAGGRKSGSKRTDREFCTNSCRVKNHLHRQQEARQRHAKGETAAKIAKDLGTTASIVKNWLKSRKES